MTAIAARLYDGERPQLERLTAVLPFVLLAGLMVTLGDGFMGGGGDDGSYLHIAQHWVTYGASLPANHWEGRWPVVLPLAGSLELFGLHRWSVALPSFIAAILSLVLVKRLGDRYFGSPVGIAAAAVLAVIPAFTRQATSATVEPIELLLILAAFDLVRRPVLAGLMLGLAFQARETAVAALPILLFLSGDRKSAVRIMGGFLAPFGVELATYYGLTGDALYRRHLSLAHTTLPTPVLPFTEANPLFNVDIIKSWYRESGIHLHWTVDGFLNLLPNPTTALLPIATLIQVLRVELDRKLRFLLLAAVFYCAALIYGLAIFPTPRMFLPALAALAVAFAVLSLRWRDAVSIALMAMIAAVSLLCTTVHPSSAHWQTVAEQWETKYAGQVETTQQDYWVFSPALQSLPSSGKPYLLKLDTKPCAGPVVEEDSGGLMPRDIGYRGHLCLYRVGAAKQSVRLPPIGAKPVPAQPGEQALFEIGQRLLVHATNPGAIGSVPGLFVALTIVGVLAFRRLRGRRDIHPRVLLRAWLPRRMYRSASGKTDIAFTAFTIPFFGLMFGWAVLESTAIGSSLRTGLTGMFGAASFSSAPTAAVVGIATVAGYLAYEFAYWLAHFLSHRFEVLWRFHAVHQSAESLSTLTNFRVHPVDSLVFANVLAIVNGTVLGLLTYVFSGSAQQYLIGGSNALMVLGFLLLTNLQHTHFWISFQGVWANVFLSPAHHQIHHSKDPAHFNTNLGSTLAIWDWMFGTLRRPAARREKLEFGVDGIADPHGLKATIVRPFFEAAEALRPERAPVPIREAAGR